MYTPYAVVYYVQRVHLMCQVNSACTHLTVSDYMTDEIILMFVGTILHIPFWFFILMVLDVKKNGGKVRDALLIFKVSYLSDVPLLFPTGYNVSYIKLYVFVLAEKRLYSG